MGTQLTVAKDGLTLAVNEPVSGDRTLRGRCTFATFDAETSATVEVRLISRNHRVFDLLGVRPWAQEVWVSPCRAKIIAGTTGIVDFELPYPAIAAPFKGGMLEVAVLVVAVSAKGKTIRIMLDRAPQPVGAVRVLRGLPVKKTFRKPFRWLTLRPVHVSIEALSDGPDPRGLVGIRVSVRGDPVRGGKASLVAAEFEAEKGPVYKHDPLVCVEKVLKAAGAAGSVYQVEFTVPPPSDQAPPAMTLQASMTRQGIIWEIRLDLENRRGRRAKVSVPIHVGTVYNAEQK